WQGDLRALGYWAAAAAIALGAASAYALARPSSGARAASPAPHHKTVKRHRHHVRRVHRKKFLGVQHARRRVARPSATVRLQRDAATGLAHVLFSRSPGGITATAERVARYRNLIKAEARGSGFGANTLEGIVFLESAGYSDAIAGSDPVAASGLTQIVAQTGVGFLHMR